MKLSVGQLGFWHILPEGDGDIAGLLQTVVLAAWPE